MLCLSSLSSLLCLKLVDSVVPDGAAGQHSATSRPESLSRFPQASSRAMKNTKKEIKNTVK